MLCSNGLDNSQTLVGPPVDKLACCKVSDDGMCSSSSQRFSGLVISCVRGLREGEDVRRRSMTLRSGVDVMSGG